MVEISVDIYIYRFYYVSTVINVYNATTVNNCKIVLL